MGVGADEEQHSQQEQADAQSTEMSVPSEDAVSQRTKVVFSACKRLSL